MRSTERERQFIVDYMASQAPDEIVEDPEKVASERVMGRRCDVWDVHTDVERWWILTEPTNLYSQKQFPNLEVVLSFHLGLTARVMERADRSVAEPFAKRFSIAWRKWEQAGDAMNEAEEPEEFQAIGMRCRESLIAFVREAAALVPKDGGSPARKAGDFVGWSDLIANTIAPGASGEERRGYLKSTAKSAWQLVNWLTHAGNATRFDGHLAFRATEHVLTWWSLSILRFECQAPDRCPKCGSNRVNADFRQDDMETCRQVTICEVCHWEGDSYVIRPHADEPEADRGGQATSEELGPCVVVEIPLRGSRPPRPTSRPRSEG